MAKMGYIHPSMKKTHCLFLLWLISRHEAHGYQIIKTLRQEGMKIGANSLYPELKSMLLGGLISQRQKRAGKRVRKVYVITAKGRRALADGRKFFKGIVGEFIQEMLG